MEVDHPEQDMPLSASLWTTHASLLEAVRDLSDDRAWERFYDFYAPLLAIYARQRGCTPAQVEEVVQGTMTSLLSMIPSFRYDRARGRFRGLLRVIVRNRAIDLFRAENRIDRGVDLASSDLLPSGMIEAPKPVASDEAWERAWRLHLFNQAMSEVKLTIQPRILEAFRRHVLDGEPTERVCAELGMSRNHLYQIKHSITRRLTERIAQLRQDWEVEHERSA